MGKIFNERLSEEDQKQRILKSFINIGDEKKNKQPEAIKEIKHNYYQVQDYEERQSTVIKNLENKIKGEQTEEMVNFENMLSEKGKSFLISLKI